MSATLAVLIATAGRPTIVAELVRRLNDQSRPPEAIICVGAGEADIASIERARNVKAFVGRRGSAHQRNDALECGGADYGTIVFLDDDFAPSRFWLERVETLFAREPHYACLTGAVLADGLRSPGIPAEEAWAIVTARDADPQRDLRIDPAVPPYGCNMAFRGAATHDLRFDERLPLYGWLEDKDFGERARLLGQYGQAMQLYGVHMGAKLGRVAGLRLGYSQIANPAYLVRKGSISARYALGLATGNIAANLIHSARPEAWIDRRGRLLGNLIALADASVGRLRPERAAEL